MNNLRTDLVSLQDYAEIHCQQNIKLLRSIYLLIVTDSLLLRPTFHFTPLHPTKLHSTCCHFRSSHLNFSQVHFTNLSFGLTWFTFPTASIHLTSLHFTSPHFTALLDKFLHLPVRRLVLPAWVKAAVSMGDLPVYHATYLHSMCFMCWSLQHYSLNGAWTSTGIITCSLHYGSEWTAALTFISGATCSWIHGWTLHIKKHNKLDMFYILCINYMHKIREWTPPPPPPQKNPPYST
jgi:hypothetical protein